VLISGRIRSSPGSLTGQPELEGLTPADWLRKDGDPEALYAAARTYPTRYLRIEWLDQREGPLPAADVEYPEMAEAAAFACANGTCSLPVFTPAEVHRIVDKVDNR